MDQKCNRGEVEFGINYENDMYGDVSSFADFFIIKSLILDAFPVFHIAMCE